MRSEKPVKTLLFTTQLFPPTGGFSRVVDALAGGMGASGFHMRLLAPIEENTLPLPYPVIPLRFLHNLYPLISDYDSRYERIMQINLEIAYQTQSFDLIHAHLAYPAGLYASRWGKRKGIPVITTCHGHDIKNISDKPYAADIWEKLQQKMIEGFHLADAVTVPSNDMARQLKTWGVKTRLIPNGIHLDKIPTDSPQKENELFILTIGRFSKVKGFDLLFKTFAKLAPRHPDLRLVVFGEGCGKFYFLDQTLSNELKGKISFITTGCDEKRKWDLIKKCTLYVCPSRMEGFGIAALEAMAAGKPVVAFDVGGVADLVKYNGILVPPYDTDAMAGAIDRIIGDPSLAGAMSSESKLLAKSFDWPIILDRYQNLYREILGVKHK